MKEKITKEILLKRFEGILRFETESRELYDEYLGEICDSHVKDVFGSIRDDEIRHVQVAEDMLAKIKG